MVENVVEVEVQNLRAGMKVDLSDVCDKEHREDFDSEWVPVARLSGYESSTVVTVDRPYLPEVEVANGTLIPVLAEEY